MNVQTRLWWVTGILLMMIGPAYAGSIEKAPHRVVITNLGRVEVFQKIGGDETRGVSPPGPHTHVLLKLLKAGRTHSANAPIPEGLVPCGYLHPANPVIGTLGEDRLFNYQFLASFDHLMQAYAPAHLIDIKKDVIAAIDVGQQPDTFEAPSERHGRATFRVALRQLARMAAHEGNDQTARCVDEWRAHFNNVPVSDGEEIDPHYS